MRASVVPSRTRNSTPTFTSLPEVVHAPRTDAVYNCHGYLTKVPLQAVVPFIEAFTSPGDLVIDMFAGSGMTGLAADMARSALRPERHLRARAAYRDRVSPRRRPGTR